MRDKWIETLIQMEQAFCDSAKMHGAEGWASYFAENGVMAVKQGEVIRGRSAIEAAMEGFFSNPVNQLIWKPEHADVSEDGTLGYTYGKYHRIRETEEGVIEEFGRYMTVWKKQLDGKWLIETDIGN